jgi:hypothetical protein
MALEYLNWLRLGKELVFVRTIQRLSVHGVIAIREKGKGTKGSVSPQPWRLKNLLYWAMHKLALNDTL